MLQIVKLTGSVDLVLICNLKAYAIFRNDLRDHPRTYTGFRDLVSTTQLDSQP